MSLTLREKLNGSRFFDFFVSPYTVRTLKPFIYRDNVMNPPWLQLMEEIEHFDKKRLNKPSFQLRMNFLHDHNYYNTGIPALVITDDEIVENSERDPRDSFSTDTDTSMYEDNREDSDRTESADELDKGAEETFGPRDVGSPGREVVRESINVEKEELEHKYPCDDKGLIIHEEIRDKTHAKGERGSEDETHCTEDKERNVFKNTEDIRERTKIRKIFPTKHKLSTQRTIDFCYVREEHIRAINTLVEEHFWPNINMKECTLYPEFTVVALYKKLVVGLGAMIPNPNKYNETYITFLVTRRYWQNAGIGSFMLYHLIESCQSTHITLHCSVSRFEALNLYFKFGFKVQCVVLNFYKPYLSSHPNVDISPHAYYLKYSRDIN